MKFTIYRDGGTMSFTDFDFSILTATNNWEICWNCGTMGDNKWYLGHPNKGRLLTPDELTVIPYTIINKLQTEINKNNTIIKTIEESL